MFKKYLGPYQYKYHSANYLSNFAVSGPENIANPYTDERKNKRRYTYKQH